MNIDNILQYERDLSNATNGLLMRIMALSMQKNK
ncbi:hypothetical protein SAMN05444682_109138 [Parapedobacter indicus]|uniref:Uncharacterized protein n=1 Tax=Parapedobacter indicus TaxID=1477437 RepID=A0A1I3QX94_9SPHI|nr:hypothetical protein CLV26_109138 [Parapedobacter indicus]SFJ38082.1 hypothetical protein SAMN05444682_109138 [Parapedobacter indicus]